MLHIIQGITRYNSVLLGFKTELNLVLSCTELYQGIPSCTELYPKLSWSIKTDQICNKRAQNLDLES